MNSFCWPLGQHIRTHTYIHKVMKMVGVSTCTVCCVLDLSRFFVKTMNKSDTFLSLVKHLLDPSRTTSLVGRVIVCSLGKMSARGGLFTRGATCRNAN